MAGDPTAQFRHLKVDATAVGFVVCTVCREVVASSNRSMEEVLASHSCHQGEHGRLEPLPQDETYVDEFLARRMNKVSGPANSLYIQEEVRSCFELCRWSDVKLVCPRDGSSVAVHGLVLAAACPVLATALASLPPLDREDITILLADTSGEEVLPFLSHLYGQTLDNTDFSSWLFTLVDFALRPVLQGQQPPEVKLTTVKDEKPAKEDPQTQIFDNALDEGDFMDDSGETESEEAKLAAVARLVAESPASVQLGDIAGPGRNTKVWRDFLQVRQRRAVQHFTWIFSRGSLSTASRRPSSSAATAPPSSPTARRRAARH